MYIIFLITVGLDLKAAEYQVTGLEHGISQLQNQFSVYMLTLGSSEQHECTNTVTCSASLVDVYPCPAEHTTHPARSPETSSGGKPYVLNTDPQ